MILQRAGGNSALLHEHFTLHSEIFVLQLMWIILKGTDAPPNTGRKTPNQFSVHCYACVEAKNASHKLQH